MRGMRRGGSWRRRKMREVTGEEEEEEDREEADSLMKRVFQYEILIDDYKQSERRCL